MNPFTLISTKKVYENPWISVREDSVTRPGGKQGIFGVMTMKNGCTVLAIDENKNIYITKEFHYAIKQESIELISGGIDENESPLDCAKRELEEEAGLMANEWINLGYIDPFTTVVNSRNYLYLAKKLRNGTARPDEGEIVNLDTIQYSKALEMVMNSEITHGASVAAILKAQQYI